MSDEEKNEENSSGNNDADIPDPDLNSTHALGEDEGGIKLKDDE